MEFWCLILNGCLQVVVCSFVYGSKTKTKQIADAKSEENTANHVGHKLATPTSAPPTQSYTPPVAAFWPGSMSADMRNPRTGIDLTQG